MNIRGPFLEAVKKALRYLGLSMAIPFFVWVPLGFLSSVPSIIDVFGIDGLKLPTGIVIGGLMLAAIGYEDF